MDRRAFLKLIGSVPLLPGLATGGLVPGVMPAICLGEFQVAGFQYHQGMKPQISSILAVGDTLQVERDCHNYYDPWAVRVLTTGNDMLGFLPRNQNRTAAAMADQGIRLSARITSYHQDADPWERLSISLWADPAHGEPC